VSSGRPDGRAPFTDAVIADVRLAGTQVAEGESCRLREVGIQTVLYRALFLPAFSCGVGSNRHVKDPLTAFSKPYERGVEKGVLSTALKSLALSAWALTPGEYRVSLKR